jgi:hypothetical protein
MPCNSQAVNYLNGTIKFKGLMYLKKIIFFFVMVSASSLLYSQGVGIGTGSPIASAALDITASNKGLLLPRVALTGVYDVITINNPAEGLLIFNTATAGAAPASVKPGYYFYTGSKWQLLVQNGNAAGDLQYWNGIQWTQLPAGISGQTLSICNGVPVWGPCSSSTVLPTVSTGTVTNIAATSVTTGGNVLSNGGAAINSRGVCYSRAVNPTIADSVVQSTTAGTGVFTVSLTSLASATVYHIRAFATNSAGTAYGADSSFTTALLSSPTVTTTQAFGIGSTSANSGGQVISNGGAPLVSRGIVYSTALNPTLADNVIYDGSAVTGSYAAQLPALTPGTTYHVRAFASNGITPVAYGNDVSFTTLSEGFFAISYTFDSVKTTSGITDPSPLPFVSGIIPGAFAGIGAGSPSFNSTAAFRFSLTGWTTGATNGSDIFSSVSDSVTKYYEVTITPEQGRSIDFSNITFRWQRSGSGVRQAFVRSSEDGFVNNLVASINPSNPALSVVPDNKFQVSDATTSGQDGCTITLGGQAFTNITTPITFRFYGINAEATGGTFSLDNVVINGRVF